MPAKTGQCEDVLAELSMEDAVVTKWGEALQDRLKGGVVTPSAQTLCIGLSPCAIGCTSTSHHAVRSAS